MFTARAGGERVDAVTQAVEAVTNAAQNAEKEEKKNQPESVSNEGVPPLCRLNHQEARARRAARLRMGRRLPHPRKSQKPGINVERALTSAGTVAYWDTQSGVTVLLFSQKLVSSPAYDEIFQKFFNEAYTAADV